MVKPTACLLFMPVNEVLSGLSKTEYLVTFLALIIGYISSEYFKGFGIIFRNRHKTVFSLNYSLFAINSFILISIIWWDFYDRSFILTDSVANLLISLLYLVFFYFLTILLFRDIKKNKAINLEYYFQTKKSALFSLVAAYLVFDQLAYYKKTDLVYLLTGVGLCILGIIIKNKGFIKTLLIASTLLLLSYLYFEFISPDQDEMVQANTHSFSKAEHLTIFISLIYAYVVTIYFKGWSYLLRDWRKIRHGFIPVLWSSFSFLTLIIVWWNTWIRSQLITGELIFFQLSLIPPFILFVIALIIFPMNRRLKKIDLNMYFSQKRMEFFLAFLLFFVFNLFLSLLFREIDLTGLTNVFRFIAIAMALLGLLIKNKNFHRVLPFVAFGMMIVYIVMID